MTGTRFFLTMMGGLALLAQGCCGHRKWVCNSACAPVISCSPKVCSKGSFRIVESCDCN